MTQIITITAINLVTLRWSINPNYDVEHTCFHFGGQDNIWTKFSTPESPVGMSRTYESKLPRLKLKTLAKQHVVNHLLDIAIDI